jgi:hypothetical protein
LSFRGSLHHRNEFEVIIVLFQMIYMPKIETPKLIEQKRVELRIMTHREDILTKYTICFQFKETKNWRFGMAKDSCKSNKLLKNKRIFTLA